MSLNRNPLLRLLILVNIFLAGYVVWRLYSDSTTNSGSGHEITPTARQQEIASWLAKEFPDNLLNTQLNQLENNSILIRRDKSFPCDDSIPQSHYARRGDHWVLYNFVKASKTFHCDESITYSTNADWTYLDNLPPLLEHWQGPVSLALYAPGTDLDATLKRIQYLRECSASSQLIKELVTFHIFFDIAHLKLPEGELPSLDPLQLPVNCSASLPFGEGLRTYKDAKSLSYPINIARNIAKEMATTHYVFPSDIELYPSPNLIRNFLEMVRLNGSLLQRPTPRVFVLPVFEVEMNVTSLPKDKLELLKMLKDKTAVTFHKYVCATCHRVPDEKGWLEAPVKDDSISVFNIAKKQKPYELWEPFYIGTKCEPKFDERLSWDGRKNKIVQGYLMCLLNYEFHILDNAFLVHRPGIRKQPSRWTRRRELARNKQSQFIRKRIIPELKSVFGERPECFDNY